jgi:hypothetical protein
VAANRAPVFHFLTQVRLSSNNVRADSLYHARFGFGGGVKPVSCSVATMTGRTPERSKTEQNPMSVLNLAAFDHSPLQREPFDYVVAEGVIAPEQLALLNRDYPEIDKPANFPPDALTFGPSFQQLLDELDDPAFEQRVAKKFGVDLKGSIKTITVRKYSEPSDGNIHTDHWSKIITLLVYFNTEWTQDGGKLRFMRSANDIEDFSAEVPPLGGTVLAFRRSKKSFHGYKAFEGERRMVQMSWVRPNPVAWYTQQIARFGTHTAKRISRLLR